MKKTLEGEGTPFRVGSLLPPNLPHPPRTFLSRGLVTVPLILPCCAARRGAVKGRGINPSSGKFLDNLGGSKIIKRAAIALVTCAVAALFARRAKIRWGKQKCLGRARLLECVRLIFRVEYQLFLQKGLDTAGIFRYNRNVTICDLGNT